MVIITDCMYRSSISAIYSLKKLGEEIVLVTTSKSPNPPSFKSRLVSDKFVLSNDKEKYCNELLELCKRYNKPTILPIGVFTLNVLAENISMFSEFAYFSVSTPEILEKLNNKKETKRIAATNDINVPGDANNFPIVVKPFCGEKFGIKASERYRIVYSNTELENAVKHFSKYDCNPIIEEYIMGEGIGISVVIGNDGIERSAFCHKRLAEYPASGGPSSSLITFKDDEIVRKSINMLKSVGFVGIAMLEYKLCNGKYYFLEINPRVWGSFGATYKANSDFLEGYLSGARGTKYSFAPRYDVKKIKFIPNIFASAISYMNQNNLSSAIKCIGDALNPLVPNAIFSFSDPLPAIYDIFRKRR